MFFSESPLRRRRCAGKYWTKVRFLGRGSYAVVFLADFLKPDSDRQQIAVKASNSNCASFLEKEYRIYQALKDCPEITQCFSKEVTLKDNGDKVYNLLLEYASAGTLKDLILKSSGYRLPEIEVRAFTRMILKGLDCMHAKGYVHCDLNPSNILAFTITENESQSHRLKLADFGVTKEPGETIESRDGEVFRGARYFMSPESVMLGLIGPELDVWSLGCTVVYMITGKGAWQELVGDVALTSVEFKEILAREGSKPPIPQDLCEEGKEFLNNCFERDYRKRWSVQMLLKHPFVSVDS